MPEGAKYYSMFVLDFGRMDRKKKIKLWRELYGYKQKVGGKTFVSKGLLEELSGKKIERSVIAVPAENKSSIIEFIRKNGITYKVIELWTDGI